MVRLSSCVISTWFVLMRGFSGTAFPNVFPPPRLLLPNKLFSPQSLTNICHISRLRSACWMEMMPSIPRSHSGDGGDSDDKAINIPFLGNVEEKRLDRIHFSRSTILRDLSAEAPTRQEPSVDGHVKYGRRGLRRSEAICVLDPSGLRIHSKFVYTTAITFRTVIEHHPFVLRRTKAAI